MSPCHLVNLNAHPIAVGSRITFHGTYLPLICGLRPHVTRFASEQSVITTSLTLLLILLVLVPDNLDLDIAFRVDSKSQNNHCVPRITSEEIELRSRRGATLSACRRPVVL